MRQTKLSSFVESWANVLAGFGIHWTANMLVLPLFGLQLSALTAFNVGLVYTAISIARSYVLRRWFNSLKWGNK